MRLVGITEEHLASITPYVRRISDATTPEERSAAIGAAMAEALHVGAEVMREAAAGIASLHETNERFAYELIRNLTTRPK